MRDRSRAEAAKTRHDELGGVAMSLSVDAGQECDRQCGLIGEVKNPPCVIDAQRERVGASIVDIEERRVQIRHGCATASVRLCRIRGRR